MAQPLSLGQLTAAATTSPEDQAKDDAAVNQSVDARLQFGDQKLAMADERQQRLDAGGTQTPPMDMMPEIMQQMPYLVAMTAIGGALTKQSGLAMLSGLNGMLQGANKGDQEGYDQAWKRYEAEYQKQKDRQTEQQAIYKMYLDAYADRPDAFDIAAKHTLAVTRDHVETSKWIAGQYDTNVRYQNDLNEKYAAISAANERARIHEEGADRRAQAKADEKSSGKGADISVAEGIIDKIEKLSSEPSKVGIPYGPKLPTTGAGGFVARIGESVGGAMGADTSHESHDLQTEVNTLRTMIPKLLKTSSRTNAEDRARADTIVRGTNWGDNSSNTKSALEELRGILKKAAGGDSGGSSGGNSGGKNGKDKFEVGKRYEDGYGHVATYKGNGQWDEEK
jgi:hypothetical protein